MGRGHLTGRPGEKQAPRHQARANHAAEPGPRTHALGFPEAPGLRQEAGWRLEGGVRSNPELLKRANGEVKIGNKNKIAPASPGCLCRKHGISRPAGPAPRCAPSERGASPPPGLQPPRRPALHPAQERSERGPESQVQISALPLTSQVTLGEGLRPCGPRTQIPTPPTVSLCWDSPARDPHHQQSAPSKAGRQDMREPDHHEERAWLSERLRPVSSCARRFLVFHAPLPAAPAALASGSFALKCA